MGECIRCHADFEGRGLQCPDCRSGHREAVAAPAVATVRSEHEEQVAVIAWARLNVRRWPELRLLHAVQNWAGVKGPKEGGQRKAEGVSAGVPDLHLPVPRPPFASLYVEMKRLRPRATKTKGMRLDRTQPTPEQRAWIADLREAGNAVEVCWSAAEAESVIEAYLAGEYEPSKEAA